MKTKETKAKMSKLKQIKIPINLDVFEPKWRLVRTRDDLTKESEEIGFIEWNENDYYPH